MDRKNKRTVGEESRDSGDALRWSVERRLDFVEQRLFWLGAINRANLIARYGVSMSQASADINRYLALNPAGVTYDKSAKRYVARDTFRPVLGRPDAARVLGELRLAEAGLLDAGHATLGALPPFDATPVPERRVDPFVLRALWHAIDGESALAILYQSMSRPQPVRRIIEPHSFAHDGFRWHVRAFDCETGAFRDFVLGRIAKPKPAGSRRSEPARDAQWHARVTLRIAPHPDLTPAQAKAIRLDYGIKGADTGLEVRQALLFYALKRLGLDTPPEARPPRQQHIVLANRAEVMACLTGEAED